MRGPLLLVLPIVAVVACSPAKNVEGEDTSLNDGGQTITDGGRSDAGRSDAGEIDAGWPYECPPSICQAADFTCLASHDNSAEETPLLRIAQLTVTKPQLLSAGLFGAVVTNAILPDAADCSVNGNGNASWLIEFDTSANPPTIRTGSGEMDPVEGSYAFTDREISFNNELVPVRPTMLKATINENGQFETTESGDMIVRVAGQGTSTMAMLPLSAVSLSGKLSSRNNCIGRYRADALSEDIACQPESDSERLFEEAGTVRAFIDLETADDLIVLGQSLCVHLSGNASVYGNSGNPVKCKRDGTANIIYQGDWCSSTNSAATGECADAVRLEGTFAAHGVLAQ